MEEPVLFNPALHSHLVPSFASIHAACITTEPYMMATFLPPLDLKVMEKWWESRIQEQVQGSRNIILQLAPNPTSGKLELAGYVMLAMPWSQTGPFRGIIEKLMVSPEHRMKGIARAMMKKVEEVAEKGGKTLIALDTVTGSPAELVYSKFGYIKVGSIPNYGFSPLDGSLNGETFFYKDLLKQSGTS